MVEEPSAPLKIPRTMGKRSWFRTVFQHLRCENDFLWVYSTLSLLSVVQTPRPLSLSPNLRKEGRSSEV